MHIGDLQIMYNTVLSLNHRNDEILPSTSGLAGCKPNSSIISTQSRWTTRKSLRNAGILVTSGGLIYYGSQYERVPDVDGRWSFMMGDESTLTERSTIRYRLVKEKMRPLWLGHMMNAYKNCTIC